MLAEVAAKLLITGLLTWLRETVTELVTVPDELEAVSV
jgi:hypothetical protein